MEDYELEVPLKDKSRLRRRCYASLLKKKRAKYWSNWANSEKGVGKLVHTATNCSCWMCGNPRKFFGELTMQERKHLEKMKDELNDL